MFKGERQLFLGKEAEKQEPHRPLGALSDYVVEQLPGNLELIWQSNVSVDHLSNDARHLVQDLAPRIVEPLLFAPVTMLSNGAIEQRGDVASLDVKMLEAAIVHSGGTPPQELVTMVDRFAAATQQPPVLTYEEIVYKNPIKDQRLFTRGEVGRSESDFYHGHALIEQRFDRSAVSVKHAQRFLALDQDAEAAKQAINFAQSDYEASIALLHEITMDMPKEHFKEFRPYLGSHPTRDLRGPSGLYSPGFVEIEVLLAGETLPDEYYEFLNTNKMYYPRGGIVKMAKAIEEAQRGHSLTALSDQTADEELMSIVADMSRSIRIFRASHLRGVIHQIPEITQGTGGEFDPVQFLRGRLSHIRHERRARGEIS